MIVREMPNGQLLCIHQTSHALMAEEFCRHWGNADFATPAPYSETMLAIAQHDNGWHEWELAPQLRDDGFPMDFVHHTDVIEKIALWRRSIDRAASQHPYAAVLVGRHASLLYHSILDTFEEENEKPHVAEFIADQALLLEFLRHKQTEETALAGWLREETVAANTSLLQFGDLAALKLTMPWGQGRISLCPVDGRGTFSDIDMRFDHKTVTFDPWPFGIPQFTVSMQGWLLSQQTFPNEETYRTALAEAPFYQQQWTVLPT